MAGHKRHKIINKKIREYLAVRYLTDGAQNFLDYMMHEPFFRRAYFAWLLLTGKRIEVRKI